jgi:hypothetical protein
VRVIHGASSNEALRAALTLRKDVPEKLLPFLQVATV